MLILKEGEGSVTAKFPPDRLDKVVQEAEAAFEGRVGGRRSQRWPRMKRIHLWKSSNPLIRVRAALMLDFYEMFWR